MKKIAFLVLVLCSQISNAQEFTVEKSTFNAQVGMFGIWVNNESRLGNEFTLKSEVGLDLFSRKYEDDSYELDGLAPVITVEPRWYYNLEKRGKKGRNVQNNGGNFLALTAIYHPDWFTIGGSEGAYVNHQLAIVPKWGIRRNVGKSNFHYEAGAGLGYNFILNERYNLKDDNDVYLDLHLRIGYTFKSSRNK